MEEDPYDESEAQASLGGAIVAEIVSESPEYGTSTLWGQAFAEKLAGCAPGDQVEITITGFLSEIAKDRIVLEITHCELHDDVKNMDDAYRKAKNEQEYVKLHQTPSIG